MSTLLFIALLAITLVVVTYVLAMYDIMFTFGKEGAAKAVVLGDDQFDHMLMWWRGRYLNDPRRSWFNPLYRPWEILYEADENYQRSLYAPWQVHWKFLEYFGIYWFGLPYKGIYVYLFTWTELALDKDGKEGPWRREEHTPFIFAKNFSYWVKLPEAEDVDNQMLDLDYLLTIHVNNPYWALFRIEDWLSRVIADTNNKSKLYVGWRTFDQVKKESLAAEESAVNTSEFAAELLELNDNLATEPGVQGTRLSYGVTINAASLVSVTPSGSTATEIAKALSARRVAELTAEATVATAKGDAEATRVRAQGEADAIEKVYRKVDEFGDKGIALQGLDAIREAGKSPGSTTIWANDPLGGLLSAVRGFGTRPTTTPTPSTPSVPPTPPTTP